ncbi:NAD(P)H-binding protein [Bradyrhizobium sp. Gha]|uniref:NAD(P)-dependent oxidoreductase n=1 Tax=Bradyrhizobium sp. Gha TaxID=1855318 RepID=UPI0008E4F4C7|nr:NAD(P)H-binding protein [Bradyrhizobium sp. Gha]SFH65829.1 Putative NADH-flavin reductase [Bradyrhizobium sp. Gha]
MRLFIVGASGRTGRHVVTEAVSRGHGVSALMRPGSKGFADSSCRILVGDALDAEILAQSIPGHDVIISCLGQRTFNDALLLRMATQAMLHAMQRADVTRYLVLSQGLLFPSDKLFIRLLRWILRRHLRDSEAMEAIVRESGSDWTIVRPPRLLDGGPRRGYRISVGARADGAASMQRADLAAFLLDEAEKREHVCKIIGITQQDGHA